MKKLIALTLVTLGLNVSVHAQFEVYDPIMNVQQILDQEQNKIFYHQLAMYLH